MSSSQDRNQPNNNNGNGNKDKGKKKYTRKAAEKKIKASTSGKIAIEFHEATSKAIGANHGIWVAELGQLARTYLPARWEKRFDKLSEDAKKPIYDRMLVSILNFLYKFLK